MVIKELKEKTERPKCDDCVSRADVLKYKCDCYDAHLLAGLYEQEIASMLANAFQNAKMEPFERGESHG